MDPNYDSKIRALYNGIDQPLMTDEPQVNIGGVAFTVSDFNAFQAFVHDNGLDNNGLRASFDTLIGEGWSKRAAIAVLEAISNMPRSPLR